MVSNPLLMRRDGESDLAYHKRIIYSKIIDRTLPEVTYQDLSDLLYGQHFSEDVCRRLVYGSCRTLQIMDNEAEVKDRRGGVIEELELKRIELAKEAQRYRDQRSALNKIMRDRAREEELNDIIVRAVTEGSLPTLDYVHVARPHSDNDLLVSLNDIHFGANIHNHWCHYDTDICKQMFETYIDEVLRIGELHGSENCIVWANGDMISGNIHHTIQVSNRENVVEQVVGVSELISQFLASLSEHFRHVYFVSVAGNHSRIDQKDRAVAKERLDNLVEWYLQARMACFDNVTIGYGDKIDTTMYVMDVRGKTYAGVHGDYDPTPTHIQSLQTMIGKPLYAVLLGHKHRNMTDVVQGIKTVMAGSFQGTDDYCISHRIFGQPEQMVCVCDEKGIRCTYDIALS